MVSKELPAVVMMTRPLVGAVQVHHTEDPPSSEGSPFSRVAWLLCPVVLTIDPVSGVRRAKASFRGAVRFFKLMGILVALFFSLDSTIRLRGSATTSSQ